MNKRLESNRVILKILSDYLEAYPDIRFSQALSNLNIVEKYNCYIGTVEVGNVWTDDFYLEPEKILERMTS